jgi:Kef-type K+ transport system membrane component KefB
MENLEPTSFVLLLTVFAVLMAASAVLSQASERAGVPVVLLFLALGMLAGREGIGMNSVRTERARFGGQPESSQSAFIEGHRVFEMFSGGQELAHPIRGHS